MSSSIYNFKHEDLIQNGRLERSLLEKTKEWIRQSKDIPHITDEQVCLFILACNCVFENTVKCISAYYRVKLQGPELFNNRDPEREDIQQQMKILHFCIMPQRTKDNCAIILHRLDDPTPSNYNMDVAMKILFMTLDATLYEDPPNGLVILFDMRHVGLMHLSRIKLNCVRLFFNYLQEGLPIKLREIHVFNVVWFFNKIMSIIQPFMKKELMSKLHLHSSNLDMDEFYKKWVPKYAMPSDFGGDLPSTDELHVEANKTLISLKKHFEEEEKQRRLLYDDNNKE